MNKKSFFILLFKIITASCTNPHIILIVADDLGWNDVGFHGSNQIPTPNIDALAYSGIILNNYYVTPICTPSRSALMTGNYPIHNGMQHTVLYGAEPRGLPLDQTILPQYLKKLGYTNRLVGKWHLGSYKKEYTPLYRGFDSHLGFWTGHQDYFDHTAVENPGWGLDMRRNLDVAYDLHGKYSTRVFTEEAETLINNHNSSKPLFLYLAHTAVHSGNPYEPLRAPDETIQKFSYIQDYNRRRFAAMMSELDDSVGKVVQALSKKNMLKNSIIIFTTDNGGPAAGFNLNAASNFPLRGVKNTLWEGGVRGAGLIWSPLLTKTTRVSHQFMHITDWLPTLLKAAGDCDFNSEEIDGFNLWDALSENTSSPRTEILLNIDDIYGNAAMIMWPWKIIKGTTYDGVWDKWYGPSGRDYEYNISAVLSSPVTEALKNIDIHLIPEKIEELRKEADVKCQTQTKTSICNPLIEDCLFNILEDPCELINQSELNPSMLDTLRLKLNSYNSTAVPPGNKPLDPRGDPKYWNYTWTNFGDFIEMSVDVI